MMETPNASKEPTQKESQKYDQMLEKVEGIIDTIGKSDLGLDELVEKVEEGFDLLDKMKSRLETTKEKIDALKDKANQSD